VEIKNLNSFAFIEAAIGIEIARQIDVIESGGKLVQETRLFDPDRRETRSMRGKEQAHDYRYFPDPDLPPIVISAADIEAERARMPELPAARRTRYLALGLSFDEAEQLTRDRALSDYFDALKSTPKTAANWVLGELRALLNLQNLSAAQAPISSAVLDTLIARIEDGTISSKIARELFKDLSAGASDVDALIESKSLRQLSDDSALLAIIDAVISAHPEQSQQIRNGNDKLLQFLIGMAMKASRGQANPGKLRELMEKRLRGD
jgi:aspartyl-tRNA(Asn)/glutamyl-tRNA(Gln) amidotransferase subunit B